MVVDTNFVAGLKQAVLFVKERTSPIGNELTRTVDDRSRKLNKETTAAIQPEGRIRKPLIRPLKKIDPDLELKR